MTSSSIKKHFITTVQFINKKIDLKIPQKVKSQMLYLLSNRFRVTIAYFAVSGLDVLGTISSISLDLRSRIIDWVYMLQVHPNKEGMFVFIR